MNQARWKQLQWGHWELQGTDGVVLGAVREDIKTGFWHSFLGSSELLGKHATLNEARKRVKEAVQRS
jgi:hypothetical protein